MLSQHMTSDEKHNIEQIQNEPQGWVLNTQLYMEYIG